MAVVMSHCTGVTLKWVIRWEAPGAQRKCPFHVGHNCYSHHNQLTFTEIKGDNSDKDVGMWKRRKSCGQRARSPSIKPVLPLKACIWAYFSICHMATGWGDLPPSDHGIVSMPLTISNPAQSTFPNPPQPHSWK